MSGINRRQFLKSNLAMLSCLAAGFNMLNGASSAKAANLAGYKALVCVYLAGGNDSFNMFVPESASAHADYAAARQFLAVPRGQLLPVSPVSYNDGLAYGFHPSMVHSQALFGEGALSVIGNVGSLIRPITQREYEDRSAAIPAQLFSHNDQTDSWMAADARGGSAQGWAGKMMDILYPAGAPRPSPSISLGGNNLWQTGAQVRSFEMGAGGVGEAYLPWHEGQVKLSEAYAAAYQLGSTSNHLMVQEHAAIQGRAIEYSSLVNTALLSAPSFTTPFEGAPLSAQLEMVARLIAVRDRLDGNVNRQVFFVRLGGWDTHSAQIADVGSSHPNLLRQLDQALHSFHDALVELEVDNNVTTFTATEFGRSLTPNGSGTDHGWGGHNLVMGGAVNGADIYGRMPQLSFNSDEAVENNRIIPSTSVDQYGATLASWFGLNTSELNSVFPNLNNFATANLGFMN